MAIIEAIGIEKKFGGKAVLKGIDLKIEAGEFVTVLGPNGAGKTTLLRVLSLLSKPSGGKVLVGGREVGAQDHQFRRRLGVLSHSSLLYNNLSARENLTFWGRLYGVPHLERRVQEVIEEVGLEYALGDPVATFSRGMVQRLAIARALVNDPDLLFLDEPYTGLDQQAIAILNTVLERLVAGRRTVFMITHNFEQGLELSDRVVILAQGRKVFEEATAGLSETSFKDLYLHHVGGGS